VIILDTDVLTLLLFSDADETDDDAVDFVRAGLRDAGELVCVSIVTIEEQLRGWLSWIKRARSVDQQVRAYSQLRRVIESSHKLEILDFDDVAAQTFARLRKARVRIGTMDLRIAAISIANDALLISRNVADFAKVPGLRVEDWTVGA
jgi:tRNA(fMet)-specific endonuclease VapC